ncbi:MAG TPA: hypothetical protein VI454_18850 [Verrucomicrobiae bacterium]|jgi:hypothetical protein
MTHSNQISPPRSSPIRWLITCATGIGLAMALPASAHPGRSLTEASRAHLLTSPSHLVALFAAGLAFILMAQFIRQRFPRRSLQILGAAAAASAILLPTIHP